MKLLTGLGRLTTLGVICSGSLYACPVLAEQNLVRDEGQHPHHALEMEPHALLAPFQNRGLPGVGFRATFTLAGEGFIDDVNDSVGLGVGADWTRDTTWIPVVMQWNFWLSEHWSVFAEPGVGLRLRDDFRDQGPDLILHGGGRYRFGDAAALTLRLGYPAFSAGISFFL